jgi:beta-glucosidase
LVGFKRIRLAAGAEERVTFEVQPKQFAFVNEDEEWVIEPGTFTVFVGGGQPGLAEGVTTVVEMVGKKVILES